MPLNIQWGLTFLDIVPYKRVGLVGLAPSALPLFSQARAPRVSVSPDSGKRFPFRNLPIRTAAQPMDR